jgi:hypothetical protein
VAELVVAPNRLFGLSGLPVTRVSIFFFYSFFLGCEIGAASQSIKVFGHHWNGEKTELAAASLPLDAAQSHSKFYCSRSQKHLIFLSVHLLDPK